MRLALIADTFPPSRSSGAVQLRDLSLELVRQGHEVSVLVAEPGLREPWKLEMFRGVQVLRLRCPRTKDVGYVRRTLAEFLMPFAMRRNLAASSLSQQRWDGVVWYSPTIFLGPMVASVKAASACRSYLIIRDIFPEWAVDIGLMGRGLPYRVFRAVARYQYAQADTIGIQTPGNKVYFADWVERRRGRLEVLQNWLAPAAPGFCSIDLASTPLAGRRLCVYAGNMGVAQGIGILIELAGRLHGRSDVGFVFVGRGSESQRLRSQVSARGLDNVLCYDEIDPDEIPGLYSQCHVGLVALDPRHRSHNIPGKFLSYMQCGLPVLAAVNPGNDIVELIAREDVGAVCTDGQAGTLAAQAELLFAALAADGSYAERCRGLARKLFAPEIAVRQIVSALAS